MPFINGQWVDEEELMALQASMMPTIGGYDRGPDAGWGLTNVGGIYGTEPVVGGEGVTPEYNPGLDACIINESMQSQAPSIGMSAPTPVNPIQAPFSQASLTPQTSSLTPFTPRATATPQPTIWDHLQKQQAPVVPEASMVTRPEVVRGPGRLDPALEARRMQALNPRVETPQIQVPQRQAPVPQRQAAARFVAPTYTAPAEIAPIDVEAIRSTVTAPAPFDFSDVSRGRLAEARKYAGQGMFGRAKQQIELGGGDWSTAMHRALRGETGMSPADLAKAKDAAVQQAKLAREAQHAANVSAAQKKHAANVLAAQKRQAAKAQGAAAKRAAAAKVAAARQAVIDAQRAAAAAARQKKQQARVSAAASAAAAKAAADKAEAERIAAAAAAAAVNPQTDQDYLDLGVIPPGWDELDYSAFLDARYRGREGDTGSDEGRGTGSDYGSSPADFMATVDKINRLGNSGLLNTPSDFRSLLNWDHPYMSSQDATYSQALKAQLAQDMYGLFGRIGYSTFQSPQEFLRNILHTTNLSSFPINWSTSYPTGAKGTAAQIAAGWADVPAGVRELVDNLIEKNVLGITTTDVTPGYFDAGGGQTEAEVAAAVADEGGFY